MSKIKYLSLLYITHARPSTASVLACSITDNMSFPDIKDPAGIATLIEEYVTAMKTVKQPIMMNREMKLAIADELQTPSNSIQLSMRLNKRLKRLGKELTPMRKTLTDFDGALAAQRATFARPRSDKNVDNTFLQEARWATKYYKSTEMERL